MFCCVRGYGGRRAWHTTLSPTLWTPFLFRPLHAWMVWCWPACVWSVSGHVVAAAVVLLVHGCVSRLMVGLFGVGSLALLRALARSDVVRVVVLLVSVLVGRARVGLRLGLCCLLGRGWCCAGAWPPSWWGLLRWCVPPPHGKARSIGARLPPTVGRVVSVCGPSQGWCCARVRPTALSSVLLCCVAPLVVGRTLPVRGPPHGGARCVGACPPPWLCPSWWCWAWVVVVCAAWGPALGSGWSCLWWCLSRRHARLVLFVRCCLRRHTVGVFGWVWSVVGLRLWLC